MNDQNKKIELIEFTKEHRYGKFDKQEIYTPSCTRNVIFPAFSSTSNPYCVIYFDFDKMKYFNEKKGYRYTDHLLTNSLDEIKNMLPPKAIFFRYGGDELGALLFNPTKEEQTLAHEIENALRNKSKKNEVLTATFAQRNSNGRCSLADLIHSCQEEVDEKKLKGKYYKEEETTCKTCPEKMDLILYLKMQKCIAKIFENLRIPHEFNVSNQDLTQKKFSRKLMTQFISRVIYLLTEIDQNRLDSLISHHKDNSVIPTKDPKTSPLGNTNLLFSILSKEEIDYNDLNEITLEQLQALKEMLIIGHNSKLPTKNYAKKAIFPAFEHKTQSQDTYGEVVQASLCGLKLSNTISGYAATDRTIQDFAQKLKKDFPEETLVDAGNGDFLIIGDHSNFTKEQFTNFTQAVNEKNIDPEKAKKSEDSLSKLAQMNLIKCVTSNIHRFQKGDKFTDLFPILEDECSLRKGERINEILTDDIINEVIDLLMAEPIQHFKQMSLVPLQIQARQAATPDRKDLLIQKEQDKQVEFIRLTGEILLYQMAKYNHRFKEAKETKKEVDSPEL